MEIYDVELTKEAIKGFKKAPEHVQVKLTVWVRDISKFGLRSVRSVPGYNDESLKGKRKGQRSIRLSRGYRAIYILDKDRLIIKVIEVNKHEY